MSKPKFAYEVKDVYKDTYVVNEFFSTMAILVGSKRALVIDCGTGVSDFKGLIESITDKPYSVALTHAHVDHAGGRGQFDELYVSKKDSGFIKGINTFQRKGYAAIAKFSLKAEFDGIKIEKVKQEPKLNIIGEGYVFDLGGRTVKVIETPGHTVGSLSYLDVENRTIFVGDVANEFLFMWLPHCTTLEEMVETHDKLLALDSYDTVWSSHHVEPQTRADIEKYRDGALEVINGKKHNAPILCFAIHDYKGAKLIYRPSNIHKPKKSKIKDATTPR